MRFRMKGYSVLFLSLLIAGCNLPASATAEAGIFFTPTHAIATATPAPTFTPTTPPVFTETPIPCDPSSADYCIVPGVFIFLRPILPPGDDSIDPTYPYASTQGGKRDAHHGVEFQNAFGTPVHAAGDGTVVFADADKTVRFSPWTNFYGNVIVIRHAGEMYTLYAHLSEILVKAGDEIRAGDEIGRVGATGGATGSHLHFEVRVGGDYADYFSTENPELWLFPKQGTGAISITLKTPRQTNYEHPLVVTRLADGSDDVLSTYYLKSYAGGFEHSAEDAALTDLPAGRYKIALNDSAGLHERVVLVEAGRLTEIVFTVR